jgi:AcrR family transcriptional regulator
MEASIKKRQSAKERKPVILSSFYKVIEAVGFENASVARVAKEAGGHPSTVIHYFGTKEQMVIALVDETLMLYRRLLARLPRDGDPGERLEQLLSLIWSREWHQAVSFSVMFSILALSRRDDEVMAKVRNLYRAYLRYLAKQISLFKQSGVIQVDDEQAAMQALLSLSEGSHYFSRYHIENDAFDEHCRHMIWAAGKILGVQDGCAQNAGGKNA